MYAHPVMLSDCVAEVESSQNMRAMRFEPSFQPTQEAANIIKAYATGGYMDNPTALNIAATSWGMFQIMGENLYTVCNYQRTLVDFLTSPMRQLVAFNAFLASIGFQNVPFDSLKTSQILDFGQKYNGNGEAYAAALEKAYKELQ